MPLTEERKRNAYKFVSRWTLWGERRIPRGLRLAVGIAFIVGGVFGFLPILGFWMIPVGVLLVGLDIPPLRHRLKAWLRRKRRGERRPAGA